MKRITTIERCASLPSAHNRGAQEAAAIEPPFLWILSKGCAKESISPSGAITRLTHRRDSDLIMCVFLNR